MRDDHTIRLVPGVPAEQASQLATLNRQLAVIRDRRRPTITEATRDAAAEAAAHARDTAYLWAAMSLAIAGGDDQMRETLAALADTDPDLVDALGTAADSIAATCRDLTKGDRR